MNNGPDPLMGFRARMKKIDDDHRDAIRRINRNSKIAYWAVGIMAFVAIFGPLIIGLIRGTP